MLFRIARPLQDSLCNGKELAGCICALRGSTGSSGGLMGIYVAPCLTVCSSDVVRFSEYAVCRARF